VPSKNNSLNDGWRLSRRKPRDPAGILHWASRGDEAEAIGG
jgi:hypothetical protein